MADTKYFNAVPLFILFREAIEASIVVSVLLTFLSRSVPALKVQVWWGVAAGVLISLVLGAVFAILYYTAQNNLFQGKNQFIFNGVICWVACIFVTILAFAMLRYKGWEAKWERKLKTKGVQKLVEAKDAETAPKALEEVQVSSDPKAQAAQASSPDQPGAAPGSPRSSTSLTNKVTSSQEHAGTALDTLSSSSTSFKKPQPAAGPPSSSSHTDDVAAQAPKLVWWRRLRAWKSAITSEYSLFFVVFFTVLREGLESVVFLFGVGNTAPEAIPISGLIGIACGVAVGVVLYYSGKQVKDIKWLLFVFAAVLFFIAAGAAENGANNLMKGGMFGPFVLPNYLAVIPETGTITTTLWGKDGRPPAPSAESGGAAAAFNDGDEIVTVGPTNLDDGYIYVMTQKQPWWQAPLYDLSGCCADTDDKNKFLALCKNIFGYNAQPCFIDAVFYLGYWLIVLSWGVWKWHKGTLLDADHKYNKMIKEQREQAARDKLASLDSGIEPSYVLKPEAVPGAAVPAAAVEVQMASPLREEQAEQGKGQAAP